MENLEIVIAGVALLASIGPAYALYQSSRVPDVHAYRPCAESTWPLVSLIIPACNEARTIQQALASACSLAYPNLEILVVNDRSTDNTGAMIEQMAQGDPRIRAILLETLPAGWLGKLNAMHQGVQQAKGDFYLFCDADVHFSPQSLNKAMAWVEQEDLDLLTLIPRMVAHSLALQSTIIGFGMLFMCATKPHGINQDAQNAYGAAGAFMLVRRTAYERTEGLPWLRLEIADDVGLAYLLHRHGAKARFGLAYQDLALTWYESVGAMAQGLEKNLFAAVGRFSIPRSLLISASMLTIPLTPVLALGTSYAWCGIPFFTVCVLSTWLTPKPDSVSRWALFLAPIAQIQLGFFLLRSMAKTLKQGALVWRGTRYDIEELKANQRVLL